VPDLVGEEGPLGESPAFLDCLSELEISSKTDSTVVLEGETGTGKELLASTLHKLSSRRAGPFVALHCGTFSDSLLQSELFGHDRGAFTGAVGEKPGRIEMAHGGTLLLDDISDLSPAMQLALLRVLQERTFQRVGGTALRQVDLRVVCATNRALEGEVKRGVFREDLFYRLNVIRIRIPPLRERPGDILPLARAFLRRFCRAMGKDVRGFAPEVHEILTLHAWPGNVRELLNVVERATVFCPGTTIEPVHLPVEIRSDPETGEPRRFPTWQEAQKGILQQALLRNQGNRHATSRDLGIDRGTLYGKIKRWALDDVGRVDVARSS